MALVATDLAGSDLVTAAAVADRGRDRLPVLEPLAGVLPDAGLARGRSVVCDGAAAVSLALALTAAATRAGSWLAVVGVPWLGVDAAREAGVAVERVVAVRVDPGATSQWAERVGAAADGFELILTRVPDRAPDRLVRQVHQRVRARGGVLIDVRVDPGRGAGPATVGADLVLTAASVAWEGLDRGSGHLRRRRVTVTVAGRRAGRPVRLDCWLPGPSGALEPIVAGEPRVPVVAVPTAG